MQRRRPRYAYVGDGASGRVTGRAANPNAGLRGVLAPSGKVIKKKL
jgi:hypothetical protein